MKWEKFNELWWQKQLRNLASIKFIILILLYIPIIYGMFDGMWLDGKWVAKIPPIQGLGFLGGGFVTLALGRVYINTKLNGNNIHEEDDIAEYEKEKTLKTD